MDALFDIGELNDAKNKTESAALDKSASTKASHRLLRRVLKAFGCFCVWLISTLFVLLAGLFVLLLYINRGPSDHFRDLFVSSVMESSAGGVLAEMFLSDDEISRILTENSISEGDEITDTTLVSFNAMSEAGEEGAEEVPVSDTEDAPDAHAADLSSEYNTLEGIEVYEVHGPTFKGKMMVVEDPSRIKVGVCNGFALDGGGLTLKNICAKYDAVAGINGGKYDDENGMGHGGMPEGVVISDGKLLMGDPDTVYGVYGFTEDNVFVCGRMTPNRALSIGVRDAVTFGPALIVNGKAVKGSGYLSGLNPRTAIGQREDGAVLLLVIEGRQANSIGASMQDIIDVMIDYGAVNAANLDGGMSSSMVYEGEEIVSNCQLRWPRKMPTAFVVTE